MPDCEFRISIDTSAIDRRSEQLSRHVARLNGDEIVRRLGTDEIDIRELIEWEFFEKGARLVARPTLEFDALVDRLAAD